MTLKIAWKHLISKPFSSFFTILAVAVALSVLGTFWTVVENLEKVRLNRLATTSTGQLQPTFTMFVDSKLSKADVDGLRAKILADTRFSEVDVVAPDQALKSLESQFGETLSKVFEGTSLPLTLKLVLARSTITHEELNILLNQLRGMNGVLDVDTGMSVLPAASISNPTRIFSWATALLVFIFAIVALLVSHLIRLAFETLRPEVETMKILGASSGWILRPLILEALFLGLAGALVSVVLLAFGVEVLVPKLAPALIPHEMNFESLSWVSTLRLLALGVGASIVGAACTWPLVSKPPVSHS